MEAEDYFLILFLVLIILINSWILHDRHTEQNKQIMAKVEHLEAVMLCNPIDLTGGK